MSVNDLQSILDNIKVGDIINIVLKNNSIMSGRCMPRYETSEKDHIIIKLNNGYNIGIKLNKINSYGFTLMALIANRFYIVSEDLSRMRAAHFIALEDLNSYKTKKWLGHLPIRGQLTKTNAKTAKRRKPGYKRVSKRRDKKKIVKVTGTTKVSE